MIEDNWDCRNAYFCWETCRINVDRVSFAGGVIKTIAKTVTHTNLFDVHKVPALVSDEALRKYRMAEELFRRIREKKVSITVPVPTDPDMQHKEIIRRQTGFVRPEDLARMRQFERPEDDDLSDNDELDDYLPYTRQVSIQPPSVTSYKTKSGFGRPDRKDKKDPIIDTVLDTLQEKIGEEIEKRHMPEELDIPLKTDTSSAVPRFLSVPDQRSSRKPQEKKRENHGGVGWKKSGSDFRVKRIKDSEGGKQSSDFEVDKERRKSVLTRLIDDVTTDEVRGPTLKDYKPLSEKQQKNTLFLLTYSPEKYVNLTTQGDDPRELYLQRRESIQMPMRRPQQHKTIDQILGLQHGKVVYRKISTDYVRTIDQIEQKEQNSLRSLEYAKHRPAISVKEYKKQNREYNENLARLSKLSKAEQGT